MDPNCPLHNQTSDKLLNYEISQNNRTTFCCCSDHQLHHAHSASSSHSNYAHSSKRRKNCNKSSFSSYSRLSSLRTNFSSYLTLSLSAFSIFVSAGNSNLNAGLPLENSQRHLKLLELLDLPSPVSYKGPLGTPLEDKSGGDQADQANESENNMTNDNNDSQDADRDSDRDSDDDHKDLYNLAPHTFNFLHFSDTDLTQISKSNYYSQQEIDDMLFTIGKNTDIYQPEIALSPRNYRHINQMTLEKQPKSRRSRATRRKKGRKRRKHKGKYNRNGAYVMDRRRNKGRSRKSKGQSRYNYRKQSRNMGYNDFGDAGIGVGF